MKHEAGWRSLFVAAAAVLLLPLAAAAQAQIDRIEINQAIGVQKNNALKFVAGKDTVVRAFMASDVTVDSSQTSATVSRDSQTVATLVPNAYDGATRIVDFQCANRAACGNWAPGSYVFSVRVNGVSRSTTGTTYQFVERAALKVLAVPIKANYNGTIVPVTDEKWKTMWHFTRNTYPVADDKFKWDTRHELDASDSRFDLETDEGRYNVWEAVAKLMPAHCSADPKHDDCFNQIVGIIQSRPNGYPNGTLQGYTYGKPANIAVVTDEDAAATIAHEIAHTYGLGDTYDGGSFNCSVNPAPDDFKGKDWDDRSKTISCMSGKTALPGVGGTRIPQDHSPYEVGGRGALPDVAEYMGSGGQQAQFWTTQDAYDRLFEQFAPSAGGSSGLTAATAEATPQRFIEFFGLIRQNANSSADVSLDPWWSFFDEASIANTTGKYMIAAVDAAGARLATVALDPEFDPVGPKGLPPVHVDPAPFDGAIPFPDDTARFQIIRDGLVVREVPVSANAPVVRNVTPTSRATLNGVFSITWDASDADGDSLAYDVAYDPNVTDPDSGWEVLATELKDRQWTQDFSQLGGGPHAKIFVSATDGINTSEAESAEFVVPAKPPEAFIEPLPEGTVYTAGHEIELQGEGIDLQDEEVADSGLQWSSNISGNLGTGSPLKVVLPAGQHTITLTVTNSAGLRATKSITVTILPTRRRLP